MTGVPERSGCQRALRRNDGNWPRDPVVLGNVAVDGAVEQDRTQRQPHRAINGALERQVDRPVGYLRRRAGEVDGDLVAADRDGNREFKIAPRRIRIVLISIDEGLGFINAVRNVADGAAHHAFGIVHQIFVSAGHGGTAVPAHQIEVALRTDLRRRSVRSCRRRPDPVCGCYHAPYTIRHRWAGPGQ